MTIVRNLCAEISTILKAVSGRFRSTKKSLRSLMKNGYERFYNRPLFSTYKAIYSISLYPLTFLKGKPVDQSANLTDFYFARVLVLLYLFAISTYWYFEIGMPNFDGMREDFAQLLRHDYIVKSTVIFGAGLGIVALIHRSIVSDYQIKQQSRSENISNYYSISNHIREGFDSVFVKKYSALPIRIDAPNRTMRNFFKDPKSGDYQISERFLKIVQHPFEHCRQKKSTYFSIDHPVLEGKFKNKDIFSYLIHNDQMLEYINGALNSEIVKIIESDVDEEINYAYLNRYLKIYSPLFEQVGLSYVSKIPSKLFTLNEAITHRIQFEESVLATLSGIYDIVYSLPLDDGIISDLNQTINESKNHLHKTLRAYHDFPRQMDLFRQDIKNSIRNVSGKYKEYADSSTYEYISLQILSIYTVISEASYVQFAPEAGAFYEEVIFGLSHTPQSVKDFLLSRCCSRNQ